MISPNFFSLRATVKDYLTVRQVAEGNIKDTAWLNQKQMADLFQKDVRTINEHIRDILTVEELTEAAVIRNVRITAADGKRCEVTYYNFDVTSERDILAHTSSISHEEALKKAEIEFEKYRQQLLNEPSPVERHFEEAVKKVKALEHTEKKLKKMGEKKKIEGKK